MRASIVLASVALSLLAAAGCSGGGLTGATSTASGGAGGVGATGTGGTAGGPARPAAAEDWTRDIVSTDLTLDLTTLVGKARIKLAPSSSKAASFEIGDLDILSVADESGALMYATSAEKKPPALGQLDVGVPDGATIVVDYKFKPHTSFDGWMADPQLTFLWPYFCGNLFPCKSDPADGVSFTMSITGVPAGLTAVFPAKIAADAPSYMPAVALAQFTKVDLGKTSKGTSVSVWHLPGQAADAATGTAHLKEVFDFYETTYGAYTFGDAVGTVSANWGPGDFGGMEHHPFWHVGQNDLVSEEVNAHEAAHGWFGDGVRIQCWEDFMLSEGTVTYMAAHALEHFSVDIWKDYDCVLKDLCAAGSTENTIALPDTCGVIDMLNDPLWSNVPYFKGAYFYRDVATAITPAVLDAALAEFYQAHVGKAARMTDLIAHLKSKVSAPEAATIDTLVTSWLKTLACPIDTTALCP